MFEEVLGVRRQTDIGLPRVEKLKLNPVSVILSDQVIGMLGTGHLRAKI